MICATSVLVVEELLWTFEFKIVSCCSHPFCFNCQFALLSDECLHIEVQTLVYMKISLNIISRLSEFIGEFQGVSTQLRTVFNYFVQVKNDPTLCDKFLLLNQPTQNIGLISL